MRLLITLFAAAVTKLTMVGAPLNRYTTNQIVLHFVHLTYSYKNAAQTIDQIRPWNLP